MAQKQFMTHMNLKLVKHLVHKPGHGFHGNNITVLNPCTRKMLRVTGTIMVIVPNQHQHNCIQTGVQNRYLAGEYNSDYSVPHVGNWYQQYPDTRRAPRQRDLDKFNRQTVE